MSTMRASLGFPSRLAAWAMAFLVGSFGLVGLFGINGCQTAEAPEAETVLWVKLNDSLTKYDKVVVQIIDRNDSDLVIYTMWQKRLVSPASDIPGYRLESLANLPFVVKITAYMPDGQLALYTQITYEGGKKSVYHKDVPPLIAKDWLTRLTPSIGTLLPPFNKDSLNYVLDIAKNSVVTFSMATASSNAITSVGGATVAAGSASNPDTVLDRDTIPILVTDMSTGSAVTRKYSVIIVPTAPPTLTLGSLIPSAGSLSPSFSKNNKIYSLMLPLGIDTVSFALAPADPRTMTIRVAEKEILPGQRSQLFKVLAGSTLPVGIVVFQGSESAFYQVTLELFRDP